MSQIRIPYNNLVPSLNQIGIKKALDKVLKSGNFILGEEVKAFEERFAAYIHFRYDQVVSVANGTEALSLAFSSSRMERKPRQCFLTVPNSAPATHTAFMLLGLEPIYCDVGEDGLMNPVDLKKTMARAVMMGMEIVAVIPVHLWGRLVKMKPIHDAVKSTFPNAIIIEDACQAFRQDSMFGAYSDAVAFSFYPTKNLGCLGDGGAIAFNDKSAADRARKLRNYGLSSDGFQEMIGCNSRLDELQAAILQAQLDINSYNQGRRDEICDLYEKLLNPEMLVPRKAKTNHHIFPIRTNNARLARIRMEEAGIGTARHYALPAHRHFSNANFYGTNTSYFPVAERLCDTVLSIPCWPGMEESDVRYVAQVVNQLNG